MQIRRRPNTWKQASFLVAVFTGSNGNCGWFFKDGNWLLGNSIWRVLINLNGNRLWINDICLFFLRGNRFGSQFRILECLGLDSCGSSLSGWNHYLSLLHLIRFRLFFNEIWVHPLFLNLSFATVFGSSNRFTHYKVCHQLFVIEIPDAIRTTELFLVKMVPFSDPLWSLEIYFWLDRARSKNLFFRLRITLNQYFARLNTWVI